MGHSSGIWDKRLINHTLKIYHHMAKTIKTKSQVRLLRALMDEYIARLSNETFNYRQLTRQLGYEGIVAQKAVAAYLAELNVEGKLVETSPGRYKSPYGKNSAEGVFMRRSNGKNSVRLDHDDEEIFVAERNSMHALNGDRVRVAIAARVRGKEAEAEVTEILKRKDQTFIGTLKVDRRVATLLTDSKYLATDIFIPRTKLRGGRNGDKAVVRITDWPDDSNNPVGEVVDVLGASGDNTTEQHAILAEFGLPYRYPENVVRAAARIDAGITPEEVARRTDMRVVTTFTIDPHDAKDFDDALSIRRLQNGNYEVGVHIADVTHYVKPDSIINREAEERATSVYLVDRVVPMLPEHLCNGICSLRPDEDKLTFSVVFEMDNDANVVDARIVRTVIRSNRRFAYEEAQEIIETGKGDYAVEILALDRLAKILRKRRYDNGSVDFARPEVRFETDEKGHPVSVYFKVAKDANKLIEEFMLLANKTVAEAIGRVPKRKAPKAFVYRVHDQPEAERLANLAELCRTFGYKIKTTGTPAEINRSLNRMMSDIKGRGEENFLSLLAIRSMAKAVYTTTNIGHYGLGFEYYTHFTSPIRRYPDMMVHRLLERYLAGGRSVNMQKLEDECKHSSEQEQLAASAERASIKYKQVEYMSDSLGEVFSGSISGVTEWGLYVELDDNLCEGLVPMRDLADDYYDFDPKNYCLIGRRNGNKYRLGDNISVQVARADLQKKQLDFVIVDKNNPPRTLDSLGRRPKGRADIGNSVDSRRRRRRR